MNCTFWHPLWMLKNITCGWLFSGRSMLIHADTWFFQVSIKRYEESYCTCEWHWWCFGCSFVGGCLLSWNQEKFPMECWKGVPTNHDFLMEFVMFLGSPDGIPSLFSELLVGGYGWEVYLGGERIPTGSIGGWYLFYLTYHQNPPFSSCISDPSYVPNLWHI